MGREERGASFIRGGVMAVEVHSNVVGIAEEDALLLWGRDGRVVQDGEREEVGTVGVLAAGGDAKFLACFGDVE